MPFVGLPPAVAVGQLVRLGVVSNRVWSLVARLIVPATQRTLRLDRPPQMGFPSHARRAAPWMCLVVVAISTVVPLPAAAESSPPIVVDADRVTYDQITQKIEAIGNVRAQFRGLRLTADYALVNIADELMIGRGHVVVIDPQGRELHGEAVTYNARTNEVEVISARAFIDRVHIRSDRLLARQEQLTADMVTLTTCNPDHPAYRITATHIDVIPGDRIIAHNASLWVGEWKVVTLPTQVISLRPRDAAAGRSPVPRLGYNNVDGIWVSYDYPYELGPVEGTLIGKYAVQQGFIVRNVFEYTTPAYRFTLTAGRNQDPNLRIYDQLELVAAQSERPLGGLPFTWSHALSAGWFRDPATGVQSSRLQYQVGVTANRVTLAPGTSAGISASYLQAAYGIGGMQGVWRVNADLAHQLGPSTTLSLTYGLVEVIGGTPFAFDAIALGDRIHEVAMLVNHRGARVGSLETDLLGGVMYSFRDSSTTYTAGVAVTTPGGISVGAQASYNVTTGIYKDIDFFVAARICDCLTAKLRYRQVRKEIWFDLGVIAFSEPRPQLPIFP